MTIKSVVSMSREIFMIQCGDRVDNNLEINHASLA